jgi:4-hydroxymandelate oxidase
VLDEQLAKAHAELSPEVLEYYSAGAGNEVTRHEAARAWARFRVRPWPLRNVASVDTSLKLGGDRFATPIAVAPSAFHGLAHPDGERASIAGAERADSLFVLSRGLQCPLPTSARRQPRPGGSTCMSCATGRPRPRSLAMRSWRGARALVVTGDTTLCRCQEAPYVGAKRRVRGVRIPDAG